MNYKISRRKLVASSGAFLSLPLLEALASRRAAAQGLNDPRRLVMIHFPNGTHVRRDNPSWFSTPDGPITAMNAPIPLQPFAGNLGDFTILKGLTQTARQLCYGMGGGGHQGSKSTFFSGRVPTGLQLRDSNGVPVSGLPGDTFDVAYSKTTPQRKSVYVANSVQSTDGGDGVAFNYELSRSNGLNIVPIVNPETFFRVNFSNLTSGVRPIADGVRNPKILEVPKGAAQSLWAQLGRADRLRLDSYVTSLTELQTSLVTTPMSGCTAPSFDSLVPSDYNRATADQNGLSAKGYLDRMKAFNSLIALGFQCDLFRSVAISFGNESAETRYAGAVPASLTYTASGALTSQHDHQISHNNADYGGGINFNMIMTRDRLHLSLVVDLVNKLKAVLDPSGSKVLDNTLIMAGFSVDDGGHQGHLSLGSPIVVAGGKNFTTPGRSIDASAYDLNDLYYTFSTLLGMNLPNFNPLGQQITVTGARTGRMVGSNRIPL